MESNITLFNHEQFGQLRTVTIEDEPWFVAADVCRALEIANVSDALKRLDDDEKARLNLGLSGSGQGNAPEKHRNCRLTMVVHML